MTDRGPSLDRGTKGGKTFALRMIEWADPDSLDSGPANRQRDRLEGALTATLRTLADDDTLIVQFRGREARWERGACILPRLPSKPDRSDWQVARGQADGLALYLRYRDQMAERNHRPHESGAAAAFDLIMRCRSDTLGNRRFPGVGGNLDAALTADLARQGVDQHTQSNLLPARAALTATLRSALGLTVKSLEAPQTAPWTRWLNSRMPGLLDDLATSLPDANAYARIAARLAPAMAGLLASGMTPQPVQQPNRGPDSSEADIVPDKGLDRTTSDPETAPRSPSTLDKTDGSYRVFTDRYDRVVDAGDLAPAAELERLYAQLQADTDFQRGSIGRLANRLQRVILAQQRRHWDFDQEEGLLDTAKLDRIVVNPGTALSFKVDRDGRFRDTVVSLLIDNSGSMRGTSIEMAAMSADVIAQALERCGVAVEILGFTTTDWRGGRPAADWARQGRTASPGRLNALHHIVYKRADQPWRRQHSHLAAMLRPSLLKENIDGEALLWAWSRLAVRPEARKILMVISDGAPNDTATIAANDPSYLDRHLLATVAILQRQSDLELCAIGIGHDVDRYYRRAITLKDADGLGPAMVGQLAALFGDPADQFRSG